MTIKRCDPWIPLDTPKGPAYAVFVIDNGEAADLQWVCAIRASRECWTFRNPEIKFAKNVTMGIGESK